VARVFISHASEDLAVAAQVGGWLREAGHSVFLDRDLGDGLRVGDSWAQRLFTELYRADAVVAVVTGDFATSPWCAAEVGIARAHGVRLLPVRAQPGASHRLVSAETQWTELVGDGDDARAGLVEALRRLDGAGGVPWSAGVPVYPGLRPFEAGQARVFFGRGEDARRLAERLRAAPGPAEGGLVAVVGPSGCGKSSLVRAGLAPLLAAEPDWLVLPPLMPADDPDADPAATLARLMAAEGRRRNLGWTNDRVAAELTRPGGLTRLVIDLLADAAPGRRALLIVDQAEELLTRTPEPARRRFATLLLEATGGPVRAVATSRSEFLDPLSALAAETGLPVSAHPARRTAAALGRHRPAQSDSRRQHRRRPAPDRSRVQPRRPYPCHHQQIP
jgi:TIR domain/AAA ATPase domain